MRGLTAVASGILRDAAAGGASRGVPARPPGPWLAPVTGGEQSAAIPWNGGARPAGATASAQGLRQLVGDVLRLAESQLANGGPVDEFGFDPAFNSRYLMPIARFFYQRWFRVQIRGLEHVPAEGPALVVAQPLGDAADGRGHAPGRAARRAPGEAESAAAGRGPGVRGPAAVRPGPQERAHSGGPGERGRAAAAGELVGVFPEGFKGIGKPFADRYRLRRFGRGGFAATAIRAGVPLIPCAIIGAEEIYPMLGNAKQLAELLKLPYFPITPTFPWLGPVGMIPLPSRWIIEFCPPVPPGGTSRVTRPTPRRSPT